MKKNQVTLFSKWKQALENHRLMPTPENILYGRDIRDYPTALAYISSTQSLLSHETLEQLLTQVSYKLTVFITESVSTQLNFNPDIVHKLEACGIEVLDDQRSFETVLQERKGYYSNIVLSPFDRARFQTELKTSHPEATYYNDLKELVSSPHI